MPQSCSTSSSDSFHSCHSEIKEDQCFSTTISTETDDLLSDLENHTHRISFEDFIEHGFGINSEQIHDILSKEWQLEPEMLSAYQNTCNTLLPDPDIGAPFTELAMSLAKGVSAVVGSNIDSEKMWIYLKSVFFSASMPPIVSVPPPICIGPCTCHKDGHLSPLPITLDNLSLINHAIQTMKDPSRYHTMCAFVCGFSVTLWYFDRTCIIRGDTFDLREDSSKFALFSYAISTKDSQCGGRILPICSNSGIIWPKFKTTPTSILVNGVLALHLAPTVQFFIKVGIFAYHTLIGRGTMVYNVEEYNLGGTSYGNQVLKMSWPLTGRPREAMVVQSLANSIPEWRHHLPRITFSATFTAEELNLPRSKFLKVLPRYATEERELHVISMSKYQKMWELDNVEEFKVAFVDCVECHYHAYHTGLVLHRDLSENNVMFERHGGGIRGVVNDWDMASLVNNEGAMLTSAGHRIGTIPFMAHDLLGKKPPPHLYRHDLESFLYILLWASVHYDFETKQRLPIDDLLLDWNGRVHWDAQVAKTRFLFDPCEASLIYSRVRPDFTDILHEWIEPLRIFFADATLVGSRGDPAKYSPRTIFHAFMAILGREPPLNV